MNEDVSHALVLFDIDYTIFNTDTYRQLLYPRLAKELEIDEDQLQSFRREFEPEMKEKFGHFNPEFFLQRINTLAKSPVAVKRLEEIFWDKAMYSHSLDHDTKEVLEDLTSKKIAIGLLSTGNTKHQLAKVESLLTYFPAQYHHIFSNKLDSLEEVLESYRAYKVYIVDDLPEVLVKAKECDSHVTTILRKTEKMNETTTQEENFSPNFIITDLKELKTIILN
jgi:FMN phosphatase YigB (HAD superfamily)